MSNIINEEINRVLYLFGYKPGRVISEQEHPELDETRGYKRKYEDDEIRQVASNYKTVAEFKKENPKLSNAAINRKMLDDLFPDRKKHKKLTDDEIRQAASNYKTVPEFEEKSPIIFSTARNKKMLDDLFPDRQLGSGRTPKYSEDYIRKEASKHKTDKDFKVKNYKVWQIAYKRGMIDDLFPNRETGAGRPKLIRKPEETQSNLSNKLSDYWSSSSTGDYNYKYEN
jgi:hypothetical protein